MSGAVRSCEELWGAGGDNDITISVVLLLTACSALPLLTFILVRMEPVLFLQEGLDLEDSEVPGSSWTAFSLQYLEVLGSCWKLRPWIVFWTQNDYCGVCSWGASFSATIKFSSFIWCLGPRWCGQCVGIPEYKAGPWLGLLFRLEHDISHLGSPL